MKVLMGVSNLSRSASPTQTRALCARLTKAVVRRADSQQDREAFDLANAFLAAHAPAAKTKKTKLAPHPMRSHDPLAEAKVAACLRTWNPQ